MLCSILPPVPSPSLVYFVTAACARPAQYREHCEKARLSMIKVVDSSNHADYICFQVIIIMVSDESIICLVYA